MIKRFSMELLIITVSVSLIWGAQQNRLTQAEIDRGWILLFDGETLFGWQAATDVDWQVKDGTIVAARGAMGLLHTRAEFSDFQLKVDFKAEPGTNSGVFLRTAAVCGDAGPQGECYELNIAPPDNPFPTGSIVGHRKAPEIAGRSGWRSYDILVEGGIITVLLDGEEVMDLRDPNPLGRGYVGLQFNQGRIAFRNVKLRPIGLEPLLRSDGLSNWKVFPGKKSEFTLNDAGELVVRNGPGQIETLKQFADFVFQGKILINGRYLNSGIFFRNLPGEFWKGYESQLHNGFRNNDPTDPLDYGTGGIYNRIPARRIVSEDFQWFTKTIVCNGPNISVWVNGYPVTSWTDPREPNENPRKGLRTQAGTITIQGHDPTTDLRFKDLKAMELRPRERK